MLFLCAVLSGCGQKAETEEVPAPVPFTGTLRLLNIKSEVNDQINELAKKYQQETGITVEVIPLPAGVDAQATLKGYYMSDQMPDIIACEASGFGNWEGLLEDMSDQDWASRTDAAYVDNTYGTLGFPYTTEAIGLAYNADILSKCGVDPASITGPSSLKAAIEAVDAKKDQLGLKAVVGYCAEPENLGWSSGIKKFSKAIDKNNEITEQLSETTQRFKSL